MATETAADIMYCASEIKPEPVYVEIDCTETQQIDCDAAVKEEAEDSNAAYGVTEEAARELYNNHTIKQEMVIGPVLLQPVNAEGTNSTEPNSKLTHNQIGPFSRTQDRGGQFRCNICSKQFSKKHRLLAHKSVHTEEKPFQCEVCKKSFSRRDYVTRHQRIHEVPRTLYKCEICLHNFTLRQYLMRHIQNHYRSKLVRTSIGKKRFQCGICQKFIGNKSDFTRHKLLHLL